MQVSFNYVHNCTVRRMNFFVIQVTTSTDIRGIVAGKNGGGSRENNLQSLPLILTARITCTICLNRLSDNLYDQANHDLPV